MHHPQPSSADVAVIGLGVMGSNLARNLARNGFATAVHNRSPHKAQELVSTYGAEGTLIACEDLAAVVAVLPRPRRIVLMVPAGDPTDAVLNELVPLLSPGDIVVDGGNAHFTDTQRRESALTHRGIHFVGAGISGGEEGALHGPAIMAGGSEAAYVSVGPLLEKIAAKVDGGPCCARVGPGGAGHFVKMVHNGIEYADMQLIAETYDLHRRVLDMPPQRIGEIFAEWNHGPLNSYLVEITAEVLAHTDPETGHAFVDVVHDSAGMKGTGGWTVQTALDRACPVPTIAESVLARSLSATSGLREAGAGLPQPPRPAPPPAAGDFSQDARLALHASKLVAYAQGFDLITAAATAYGWDVDLATLARIWRGGCIIRAGLLDDMTNAYTAPARSRIPLLTASPFREALAEAQLPWRRIIGIAAAHGVPIPAMSASLAYYDSLRADRLPAALLQAQRDYFGAHGYQRVDRPGFFHTDWAGARTEGTA